MENNDLFKKQTFGEYIDESIKHLEYIMFEDDMGGYSPYLGAKVALMIISPILLPTLGIYHGVKKIKSIKNRKSKKVDSNVVKEEKISSDEDLNIKTNEVPKQTTKYSYTFDEKSVNEETQCYYQSNEDKQVKTKTLKK